MQIERNTNFKSPYTGEGIKNAFPFFGYGSSKNSTPYFFETRTKFDPSFFHVDYYPFGQIMPNRHASDNQYRYGFNGMERSEELKGQGNNYTTEFRQYDPRLGRWLSPDPLAKKAAGWSPYRSFFDNPILYTDNNGLFETRKEARQYRRDNGIKGGKVRKNGEGGYDLNDKKNGIAYTKGDESLSSFDSHKGDGVVESAIISPAKKESKSWNFFGMDYAGTEKNKGLHSTLINNESVTFCEQNVEMQKSRAEHDKLINGLGTYAIVSLAAAAGVGPYLTQLASVAIEQIAVNVGMEFVNQTSQQIAETGSFSIMRYDYISFATSAILPAKGPLVNEIYQGMSGAVLSWSPENGFDNALNHDASYTAINMINGVMPPCIGRGEFGTAVDIMVESAFGALQGSVNQFEKSHESK